MTALVPSEMACLESSPGRMSRTEVWISRDEMVDFLLSEHNEQSQPAARRKRYDRQTGGELGSFFGDSLEEIGDERVEDEHGLVGDTGIGVHLLEDLRASSYSQPVCETNNSRRVAVTLFPHFRPFPPNLARCDTTRCDAIRRTL